MMQKGRNMPKVTADTSYTEYSYPALINLLVSLPLILGQLYGDVLYFYTEYRDGFSHSEMGHPIYFWFYFVFMNSLWIVIPFALILDAWKHLSTCQRAMDASKFKKH
ncbi:hypothetical protein lerEdw1_005559 [Lerista edwardsae]|nr:hypothetical protein lerEdw1_005559 [Lerista edwardsae]